MNEKTITREEYENSVSAMRRVYEEFTGPKDERMKEYANAALKAAGITIEPEPILPGVPGVSGGEKLVELVVAMFRTGRRISGTYQPEANAILDQLETMGISVEKFRDE